MSHTDLRAALSIDPEAGHIGLKGYRMVLLSACALGALRRELIETLGLEGARGVMKRFGHAAGLSDGMALAELFPTASLEEHFALGPALHGLEGVARVAMIPDRTRIDPAAGELHFEGYWENSFEAEQHLALYGRSDEPVCWTLAGYATGHSSSAAGERTVVVETECKAMGHERCRFTTDLARNMPVEAEREERDYEKHCLPEVLQELVDRVKQQSTTLEEAERKVTRLEDELAQYRPTNGLVGHSSSFEAALSTAKTVAPVDTTVLVLGESGTGKEGLARFIHDHSLRHGRPFVAVNCSALPETLQEAELFGYAKGAFTGASVATAGLFEAAHKGTLFLDEIGDLSPTAQTKILRAVQEGEIKRLGETRTRRVDVRVVAATHRDLKAMVATRQFREDLYYRLSVITITLPPLRDRGHDRLLLAEHFRERVTERIGRAVEGFECDAKAAIERYPWPGNVRELENAIERAVIMTGTRTIRAMDLPEEVSGQGSAGRPATEMPSNSAPYPFPERDLHMTSSRHARLRSDAVAALEEAPDERARLRLALETTHGNRDGAAQLLGISRTTLWRRMKREGLIEA